MTHTLSLSAQLDSAVEALEHMGFGGEADAVRKLREDSMASDGAFDAGAKFAERCLDEGRREHLHATLLARRGNFSATATPGLSTDTDRKAD